MAQISYSGTWGSSQDLASTRTLSLSGGGGATGIVNNVWATLRFSTNAYSKYYTIQVTLNFSNGTSVTSSAQIKMSADNYTDYSHTFYFSGVSITQANAISSVSVVCTQTDGSKSQVFVKFTASATVDYTVPTKCGTPTIYTQGTKTTDSTMLVWWSQAANGVANTVYAYVLEYSDSSNGSTWGSWENYGLYYNSTSVYATLPSPRAYRRFRVRAVGTAGEDYYGDWAQSSAVLVTGYPTTPGNLTVTPETWESGNVTLEWEASTVTGAQISKYYIVYSLKKYGASFGAWTALANTTSLRYSYNPNLDKGDQIQFKVYALSSDDVASAYSNTVTVIRETDKPYNLNPVEGWYVTDDINYVNWLIPDSLMLAGTTSQVRYSTDNGATWSAWAASEYNLSFNAHNAFASVASGDYFLFEVRVRQTNGDVSDAAQSGKIYKNAPPGAPVILAPYNAPYGAISNGPLYAVLRVPADANGHKVNVDYSIDGGEWVNIERNLTEEGVVSVKLTAGGQYSFRSIDEYGASSSVSMQITIQRESFTDDPVAAGTTRIKAQHIQELRAAVTTLYTLYYQTPSYPSWAENVVAGTTSIKHFPAHVQELRAALAALYSFINGLSEEAVVAAPQWAAALSDVHPTAAAINEIRNAIRAI